LITTSKIKNSEKWQYDKTLNTRIEEDFKNVAIIVGAMEQMPDFEAVFKSCRYGSHVGMVQWKEEFKSWRYSSRVIIQK